MTRRPWTDEETEKLRHLYVVERRPVAEIALILDRVETSVHGHINNKYMKRDRRAAARLQATTAIGDRIVKWERRPVTLAPVSYLTRPLVDLSVREKAGGQTGDSKDSADD